MWTSGRRFLSSFFPSGLNDLPLVLSFRCFPLSILEMDSLSITRWMHCCRLKITPWCRRSFLIQSCFFPIKRLCALSILLTGCCFVNRWHLRLKIISQIRHMMRLNGIDVAEIHTSEMIYVEATRRFLSG